MAEHTDRQDTDVFPGDLPITKDPTPPTGRRLDVGALVAGTVFIVLAIVLMSGVDVSLDWFDHGLVWIALVAAGIALLVNELRKARTRR
ncbi:hypothetical protein GCU67_17635 [Modestobacter muralis]|uniref:Uncharacterized protein n=1 Tax=Modestobacter muralis TaxID=1608614 RepID=A0A6P0EZD8_9ACTN|nr:hypothetical protein [Modestobacter muralis]NEK95969.1 hypothetical protein [Modestobacter muralis]NEN52857.1 hypothetical protein [Modestobacter muralis]